MFLFFVAAATLLMYVLNLHCSLFQEDCIQWPRSYYTRAIFQADYKACCWD